MFYSIHDSKCIIYIKVIPNSRTTQITEVADNELLIKIQSKPDKNAANNELLSFMAKLVGVKKECIKIISGSKCRNKVIAIEYDSLDFIDEIMKVRN